MKGAGRKDASEHIQSKAPCPHMWGEGAGFSDDRPEWNPGVLLVGRLAAWRSQESGFAGRLPLPANGRSPARTAAQPNLLHPRRLPKRAEPDCKGEEEPEQALAGEWPWSAGASPLPFRLGLLRSLLY
ncbi:Hypothetical predicted protein [Podarcis lilfordi]|uniref:Uncharacterized protein n=1 Tax=Podarcis lilfordi TaxID=74358 RepID=A0AA35L970_9SAUR|nr:Hypothetical predicted protein [Podarcis lilfordi]